MENNFIPEGLLNCSRHLYNKNEHVLLKYKDKTSDKFWAAIPDGDQYIIIWGKNGNTPQKSQVVPRHVAVSRLDEKIAKGYLHQNKNELLDYFKTNPKWFVKVNGSAEFNRSISAQFLTSKISAELKLNHSKTNKMKL